MAESRRLPTHLEDFVFDQERRIRGEEEGFTNMVSRKVTLRISVQHYAALKLLARRYDVSVTAIAQSLLENAALDAGDLAGITGEDVMREAEEEVSEFKSSGLTEGATK